MFATNDPSRATQDISASSNPLTKTVADEEKIERDFKHLKASVKDPRNYIFGEVWSPYQECLHALYCAQECARSEDGPSKQDIDKFLTEAESWNARVSEKSLRLDFDFTKASLTEMKEPTVPTDVELWQILFDRMSNHHETISERRSTSKLDLEQITTDQEYIKRKMDECKTSPA